MTNELCRAIGIGFQDKSLVGLGHSYPYHYIYAVLDEGSYGKAFKAIREDEIAARSMGINLFKHKVMSFTIGSFLAGIGGGLLAVHLGTMTLLYLNSPLTFNILLIVVLGGWGISTVQ